MKIKEMYKTIWIINDKDYMAIIIYHHFNKDFQFPSRYEKLKIVHGIDTIRNIKLEYTPKAFLKCLRHKCTIYHT